MLRCFVDLQRETKFKLNTELEGRPREKWQGEVMLYLTTVKSLDKKTVNDLSFCW